MYRVLHDGDGFIDFRRIWGVLSLDEKIAAKRSTPPAPRAFECGDLSYRAVVRFIVAAQEANTNSSAPQRSSRREIPAQLGGILPNAFRPKTERRYL